MNLRTPLCDRLGLTYPILQSGMGGVAGPDLVAEVSNAGGLGILAGLNQTPEQVRTDIRKVRSLTDRPFGVNLWLHPDLRPPVDVRTIPAATIGAARAALDTIRGGLGLPASGAPPTTGPDVVEAAIEVILEERVPVFSIALGDPGPELVRRCHERGIAVMAMVKSVADARTVERSGVDVVVAQGAEAGGHRSEWTKSAGPAEAVATLVIVPQIVDAVRVPVVAAGGIADGRGVVAALALGAQGALLGTRFVVTRESLIAEFRKKSVLEADSDATVVTDSVSGLWARYLKNAYIEAYARSGAPVLPVHVQTRFAQDIFSEGARRHDAAWVPLTTGQSAGLIHDLPGAGEVVAAIVREASAVLARLAGRHGAGEHLDREVSH
jgi:nitronate monooxygenase